MDESEDNMNGDKIKSENVLMNKEKPKKRSLVERELETSLTAHITSPITNVDSSSMSRYGRARRLKANSDFYDTEKSVINFLKSSETEKSVIICQPTSPVYKMQASNSLIYENAPKLVGDTNLDNQIENIYNANISLSRFGSDEKNQSSYSPAIKGSKVYMRKDLIQSNEKDETKNSISPARSTHKSNSHLNNILERSSEKYNLSKKMQNGYFDTASVVKTLDFDSNKRKRKDSKESKSTLAKSDLFELEAKCAYQVGDIAWARMGTFPFWPCIVTREPGSEIFVKTKLFGKSEHYLIHVTFFCDNGRRSWIIDSMLRSYQGLDEFEKTRDQFTPEAKKKDPKLYGAFFVSEKKLALWHTAIEEAEIVQREPKRFRIDILNEMLGIQIPRQSFKTQKKVTRTDSDVSLSESLLESLFSEDDGKLVEIGFKRNKSLDVSEVVTACLDNMAAKSGITMIQRQSHMDIWLQKAKSQTPEKLNVSVTVERIDNDRKSKSKERDNNSKKKKKSYPTEGPIKKPYSFRKSTESRNLFSYNNEHDYSKNIETDNRIISTDNSSPQVNDTDNLMIGCDNTICIIDKVESLKGLESNIQDDDNNSEINVEIITDVDYTQDEVGAVNNNVKEKDGDSEIKINNLKPTAVDVDVSETERNGFEQSEVVELSDKLSISETEKNMNNLGSENKENDAFIIQNDVQNNEDASVNLSNKIDNAKNFEENDMSIDDDATSSHSEQGTSQEGLNEEKKDNVSASNKDYFRPEENANNEIQNQATCDMSVDNVPDCLNKKENLGANYYANEKAIDTIKLPMTDESPTEGLNKPNSEGEIDLLSSVNKTATKNNCEAETEDTNKGFESIKNTITNSLEENPIHVSDLQEGQSKVGEFDEFVPKIKLTVMKEANVNSFESSPSSWELTPPKRRSSRKKKEKKVKKEQPPMEEPEFLQYLEMRQDAIIDEHPELSQDEITEYLYKTWQFENNLSQKNCSRRKSKSPSEFTSEFTSEVIDEDVKLEMNEVNVEKSQADVEVSDSQPYLEIKTPKRLRLKLRKSDTPSVIKKSDITQLNKGIVDKSTCIQLPSNLLSVDHAQCNEKEITNNISNKIPIQGTNNISQLGFKYDESTMKDLTPKKDMWFVTAEKSGISLRISKALLEPKVVLERQNDIYSILNTEAGKHLVRKGKFAKEKQTETNVELKPNTKTKSMKNSNRLKLYSKSKEAREYERENCKNSSKEETNTAAILNTQSVKKKESQAESKELVDDKQENIIIAFKEETKTAVIPNTYPIMEKKSENMIPDIEDVLSAINAEKEVLLSKRRSLRLRNSQSPSRLPVEKREQTNDQTVKNEKSEQILEDDVKNNVPIVPNQKVSSSNSIIPVENNCAKGPELANSEADSVSLSSYLTNGFVDRSSDKDFDPETVSLNSLSSEFSNASEVLPNNANVQYVQDKSNVFRKLLESDNESKSSLDNITLSELKTKSKREETSLNLRHSLENSLESIKSDSSEKRRLRLVLTDCLLDTKGSKLPEVKEVRSDADVEFEISQSNAETITSEKHNPREPLVNGFNTSKSASPELQVSVKIKKEERDTFNPDPDTISIESSGSETSIKRKGRNKQEYKPMEEPEFLQYLEMRQDALIDEHPEVTPSEVAVYLYKTWQYEESLKSDIKKNDDIEQSNLVKGVNSVIQEPQKKKKATRKKLINIEKIIAKSHNMKDQILPKCEEIEHRELPKRKASKPFYKEDFSDIEDEIELFEIFKIKKKTNVSKIDDAKKTHETANAESEFNAEGAENIATEDKPVKTEAPSTDTSTEDVINLSDADQELEYYDEEELYFEQLTNPKPNVFKGLLREKVCEICEKTSNLVKCKGCSGMFHIECVKKEDEFVETPVPTRGRKKKKKTRGRKPKHSMDSNEESHSDDKSQDLNASEENMSIDEIKDIEPIVIPDAENFEMQLEAKMKEFIETVEKIEYDSYSSDDGIDWEDAVAGKCEIVDIKPKVRRQSVNADDFKCKNCQKDDTPICFVCKSPVSPRNNVERRQKCQVAHCHKYYHLECLEHWPQTQFNSGEPSKNNKKIDEHFEAMACPRHVCHTCVCDDPRGCKTRFSGDKLARCVRCPATYHSFTKCLPAGSQILSASHIVCPRHYEHRPGKIPYHVNTGWCFICALGGNLICCDYCPTSFHADCLNIEPPEGGYMCEDCETGRLPLYGEMVWVKLGHYRWWPGIVLHPSEIPDNIMSVKHSPGEFVVRFFGQYDHYWVNRGRVFPFQEGDSGRISTQKSKIDAAFTKAMEHAQRAFEILKNVEPNDEESQDIQSSLLPPHYVKLKVNKPCGALYGRKVDIEESSLTQCECNPDEEEPCGPYSHCLNRMLLTECGPTCRAGERCQNRAFEKRQYPKMAPYRTPHRGWGLKTLEPIKAGQFVIEYVGELIDEAEFRRRMQRKHEIRDENFYFLTLDKERLIDAGPKGNLARFMNHCCEPNCETQKWTVLGDVRVGLFAIHDIPANTEVTFNYNLECTGIEKKQCMCGAKRCSGYIGAKPKQDEPQPKKLKIAAKRTYKKRKNPTDSQSPTAKNKPKRPVGRPAKPRELTEIEKDLLIIKNATNGISSDSEGSGRLSSLDDKDKSSAQALKRKRVSFSTEEIVCNGLSSPSVKKIKLDDGDQSAEVGD